MRAVAITQVGVRERHAEHDYVLATWNNLYICLIRVETTTALVQRMAADAPEFADGHDGRIGLLTLIEDGAPPPPGETRTQLAHLLRSADYVQASAVVFEGNSFRAAIVRSVAAGLSLLSRRAFPFPHQVFGSLPESVAWLRTQLGEGGQSTVSDELLGALRAFRERLNARFPKVQ
jgi:hypothetical protein